MEYVILIVAIILVVVLTKYYTVLLKRMTSVYEPVVVPFVKRFYAGFVELDEKIAGTDRKPTGTAYNKSDRYVDVKDPYKRVSFVIVAMLLSVLTLYINKSYGIFLLIFWLVWLVFDVVCFPIRKKIENSKLKIVLNSSIIQIVITIIIFVLFEQEIRKLLMDLINQIN
ncbi:MAG: hypothetical protein IJZ25_04640 [Lachnospiraceae bacterium]|nr:hypothetical protein [Lachnospiraceae bacterium]